LRLRSPDAGGRLVGAGVTGTVGPGRLGVGEEEPVQVRGDGPDTDPGPDGSGEGLARESRGCDAGDQPPMLGGAVRLECLPALQVDRVLSDNVSGGYQIARHLLDLGHQRIAVIGAEPHSESIARRLAGVRQALGEAGIKPTEECLATSTGEQFKLGFATTQRLSRQRRRPTAVIALTDMLAVGALHGAWKAGLQLPADLSVTGFDDIPLASYVLPELTTIAQPITQMGERAVHRLLRLVQEHLLRLVEDPELKPECVVLRTCLIVRNSTVAPPAFGSEGVLPRPKRKKTTLNVPKAPNPKT